MLGTAELVEGDQHSRDDDQNAAKAWLKSPLRQPEMPSDHSGHGPARGQVRLPVGRSGSVNRVLSVTDQTLQHTSAVWCVRHTSNERR